MRQRKQKCFSACLPIYVSAQRCFAAYVTRTLVPEVTPYLHILHHNECNIVAQWWEK